MSMIEFISASENFPFSLALAVMIGIALLEGITSLLGAGFSHLLDTLIPEHDLHADVSALEAANPLSKLLGWLRIGQVPILMLVVIFLTAFGLLGLGFQAFVKSATGALLPGWIAAIPVFLGSLPFVRVLGGLLERLMPKDETEAVSDESFVGRMATITLGTAKQGSPAQAKVKDQHGYSHYIMVEPDSKETEFVQGQEVLLVRKQGPTFQAIENTNEILSSK